MPFAENLQWLIQLLMSYGYVGVFAISLLGNLLIFVPIPYLLLILGLGASLDPVLVGIVGGFGATVGKIVSYTIGAAGRKFLSQQRRERLDYAKALIGRYGALAIFFFAASPLPDDVLYIPLGMMRYNLILFFISCLLGKIVLTSFVAAFGRGLSSLIIYFASEQGGFAGIFLTILFIAISIYVTLRLDWEKVFIKYIGKPKKEGEGNH